MMMMRTAGGPPPVSPLDFNERKTPLFTRTTWIALGVVGLAHVGLGAALYAQRFELAPPVETPPGPIIDTFLFERPTPPPPIAKPTTAPPAPNTRPNPLPAPPATADTITVVTGETISDSTVINTDTLVEDPAPAGTAVEPTPPRPPAVITSPSWARQPSARQLMEAYPQRALARGVSGSAALNCLVTESGNVSDCRLTSETPAGQGFGRAAQGLTRYFRLNPRTVDGAAEGSRVVIGLRFDAPAD